MDPSTLKTISDCGTIGVCLFMIWMGWQRESRAAATFDALNKTNHAVHVETISQMKDLTATVKQLHDDIRSRPCIENDWHGEERRQRK